MVNNFTTIDQFIQNSDEHVKEILTKIRETIKKEMPEAEETINYAIPTFKIKGKNAIHFAVYKNHVAIYPGPKIIEKFLEEIENAGYATSKGTIQFKLDKKIPYTFIKKIAAHISKNYKDK